MASDDDKRETSADAASAPPDPLADAIRAMDHGDLAGAREKARALLTHGDESVRKRARELIDQLGTDPVIMSVMLASGALIVALYLLYHHAH